MGTTCISSVAYASIFNRRFPAEGGTGGIWKKVSKLLPAEKQQYGSGNAIVAIDQDAKFVTTASGRKIQYKAMISTVPLDCTLRWLGKPQWADGLQHSSSHIVGFGIRGECPHGLKCWLYFPEDNCPFYRTTIFSHYARNNCPGDDVKLPTICMGSGEAPADSTAKGGPWWSLMFEISESQYKPVEWQKMGRIAGQDNWPQIVQDTLIGAINTKLMGPTDEVVSIYHRRYVLFSAPTHTSWHPSIEVKFSKGIWFLSIESLQKRV